MHSGMGPCDMWETAWRQGTSPVGEPAGCTALGGGMLVEAVDWGVLETPGEVTVGDPGVVEAEPEPFKTLISCKASANCFWRLATVPSSATSLGRHRNRNLTWNGIEGNTIWHNILLIQISIPQDVRTGSIKIHEPSWRSVLKKGSTLLYPKWICN